MEVKERIVDLRQYFIYLWENAILIILIAGICAGGMLGFSYKKQKAEIASTTAADKAVINTIINQNHDAFYATTADKRIYTDAVPPADTYNSAAKLYIDFNFDSIEGGESLDISKVLYGYQQDALMLIVSDEALQNVIDKLDLHSYDDMKEITPNDLKWMVNKNMLGANMMQVVVSDVDPDRAKLINEAVLEEFTNRIGNFASIDKIDIIDHPSTPQGGMQPTETAATISKKKLLKYAIVGGAGGFILIAGIFLLIFIFNDSVRNSLDVAYVDMKMFGTVSKSHSKREECCKRLAFNISLLKDKKKIAIIPVDKKSEDDELVSMIKEELAKVNKDIKVETSKNIIDSADATMEAVNSDAFIVLAKYGKTRIKDMIFAKSELDKTEKENLGVILESVR